MIANTVLDLSLVFIFLWKNLPLQLGTLGAQDLAELFTCSLVISLTDCRGLKDCLLPLQQQDSLKPKSGKTIEMATLELSLCHRT